MMDTYLLWSQILEKIKSEINSLAFQTWFEETELYDLNNGVARIIVPFPMHKKHILIHYNDSLKNFFLEFTGKNIEIELYITEEIETLKETSKVNNIIINTDKNIYNNDNMYLNTNLNSNIIYIRK